MEEGDVWKAIQKQPDLDHAPSDLVQVCLVISTCSLLNINKMETIYWTCDGVANMVIIIIV